MEIKLLKAGYKDNEKFYEDFLNDRIKNNDEYFSGEVVNIDEAPDFPVYIAKGDASEKKILFRQAFNVIDKYYLNTDRDIHFNELFWHSLLCIYKRDYLLKEYPQLVDGIKYFKNIVTKKFDWENYIYKCILGAQYVYDNIENEKEKYYDLIVDNLDLYNYIIKYEIFRNDKFLINVLDIIDEFNLTKILKSKVKGRDDLGKDERVGRRILLEFNKNYPIEMSPMLEKMELEELFFKYLDYYWD
ncbi:MAG: hypothetical protein N4A40_13935 [Tissierellales bacterium]|jgi:hypothetical protein|nr:hypothetical protein [Tissierellales bacterium]